VLNDYFYEKIMEILRTDSTNKDFVYLVSLLDKDLAERDGQDHSFYAQFNKIVVIKNVIVLYKNGQPVACGAIKTFDKQSMEVKRMFTLPEYRGKGLASIVLNALEIWTKESGYIKCVLETGKRQPEAIALYKKSGYSIIPNYDQYAGIANSVCFVKLL
jgi:putative acetyltransferase